MSKSKHRNIDMCLLQLKKVLKVTDYFPAELESNIPKIYWTHIDKSKKSFERFFLIFRKIKTRYSLSTIHLVPCQQICCTIDAFTEIEVSHTCNKYLLTKCQTHGESHNEIWFAFLLELSCHLIMKEKEKNTILKGQLLISKWLMTVHRKSLETPHRLKYALLSFWDLPRKNCVQNTFWWFISSRN